MEDLKTTPEVAETGTPYIQESSRLVQMRLQPQTLKRLDNLANLTKQKNKTQVVSSAIELSEEIIKSIKDGAKVYIETADGQKEVLKIIGM